MARTRFVPEIPFDEYREMFAEHLAIEREDGILTARMHTDGGPVLYSLELHAALPRAFEVIGRDPRNEVVIITGTGPTWIMDKDDTSSVAEPYASKTRDEFLLQLYRDGVRLIESVVHAFNVPTIAAVNGPGWHTEFGLLCDLTICSDEAVFFDHHYARGVVAGDGGHLVLQELLGLKRAAYALYTSQRIDAIRALEWGLVNEVVPTGDLMDRAKELAFLIRKAPAAARHFQSEVVKRPWRRRIVEDLVPGVAQELLALKLDEF